MTAANKVCLVVIDGWGLSLTATEAHHPNLVQYDAIANANTPVMSALMGQPSKASSSGLPDQDASQALTKMPCTALYAHGLAVGLPEGLMGNSEVGHLNIGAGRVVYQDIVRIDAAISENQLSAQPNLASTIGSTLDRVHLLGLVSDGGVHSHIRHLFALLEICKKAGIANAYVHMITDGRDTGPSTAKLYAKQLLDFMEKLQYGSLATVSGRYYAMDRDKRWERTKLAFDAFTHSAGETWSNEPESILSHFQSRYDAGETDEFFKPAIVNPKGLIQEFDTVVFFNYRSDRMRQITSCFLGLVPEIQPPKSLQLLSMTQYNEAFAAHLPVIFPPQSMANTLAEWIAHCGLTQCHIAETEKYAHVTFFFNGGREICFTGEDRVLVPSPKVSTYDQCPSMSVHAVAEKVCEAVAKNTYALVMCNLAPPDMVGHTGSYEATLEAVAATDTAIGRILATCRATNTTLVITSDHGNAEKMKDEQGTPHTAHTTARVPLIICDASLSFKPMPSAALCDVAPTLLALMKLPMPEEMTGSSLI